ncbi:capsid protein [Pseudoalteromonas sp. JBTF-M23]|uniref:Capsid protein n=1 Tax=Pseudoalteromonas caenipelagi TaxID=2726988 RepID=A0A849VEY0_9GAMM|nr:capsid protein [Pseudoalteromonas caenipelagi]NOU50261.1 capsid protein [Pseudoalteromonas caenipelagi]
MSNGMPFTPSVEQTAVAIAYKNKDLIADRALPYAPIGKREYSWTEYKIEERFTVPDTKIGRKSEPNQVEFTSDEKTGSVTDYGLTDVVPNDDIKNAPANYNPLTNAAESVTDLVLLDREVRVANFYNKTSNYGKHHKLGVGELKYIDDPDLNVLKFILEIMNDSLMRPNCLTTSRNVITFLQTHPRLIKGYNGTLGDDGLLPLEWLKNKLELDHINIGEARVNTKKKGQGMQLERAWRDSISLTYHDPLANFQNRRMTFALTARYGERVSSNRNVSAGLRGGVEVLVGESVQEQLIAKDCGILLTDVLTPAA